MPKKSLPDTKPRPGVNTRLRTSLREKLEAAASENNRTLGNEIETRLEASFGHDLSALIQKAVAVALAEDRRQREAEHEERCFGPRPEAIGRQYRY